MTPGMVIIKLTQAREMAQWLKVCSILAGIPHSVAHPSVMPALQVLPYSLDLMCMCIHTHTHTHTPSTMHKPNPPTHIYT